MRKIIVTEFLSLDGVMEAPGPDGSTSFAGWTMPYWGQEVSKFKLDELMASDAQLLGRVTYEGFAAAWPGQTDPQGFADRMNSVAKYVVSTTLTKADWENSHIIKDNVAAEIKKIKEQSGMDILVAGSATLVNTLIKENLVDEYRLLVYPVVVGQGKKLFKDGTIAKLQLTEAKSFPKGVVLLRYTPAAK